MPKIGIGKEADPFKPHWTTTDGQHVKLYLGNVTDVLARLPAKSVHMCVTSPPYWGLRDYGTANWVGGRDDCDHVEKRNRRQQVIADRYREITVIEYASDLPLSEHPIVPCTVLDPFIGSGTTCAVSIALGRRPVGIDLSEKYVKNNAISRIEGALLSRPALVGLVRREKSSIDVARRNAIGK